MESVEQTHSFHFHRICHQSGWGPRVRMANCALHRLVRYPVVVIGKVRSNWNLLKTQNDNKMNHCQLIISRARRKDGAKPQEDPHVYRVCIPQTGERRREEKQQTTVKMNKFMLGVDCDNIIRIMPSHKTGYVSIFHFKCWAFYFPISWWARLAPCVQRDLLCQHVEHFCGSRGRRRVSVCGSEKGQKVYEICWITMMMMMWVIFVLLFRTLARAFS